jgi:drug/metabolite transporter (DMT)-like permease
MAYLGVIVIWTTTPLAIKWSGQGPGFLFGVTGRMAVSAVLALAAVALLRTGMPFHPRARRAYLAAGLGIYGAMLLTYWAAQFIPSGWIAVLFGLAPIMTGLLAMRWLEGPALTPARIAGMLLGVVGLAVIFARGSGADASAGLGVLAVLTAALIHSASAVWIKRVAANVPALAMVAGGLSVATPLFLLTWAVIDGHWPAVLPMQAVTAIVYLSVVGSLIGFALYYYVLHHLEATRVALITLVTPVTALLLGHFLNGEALTGEVWAGTGLIVAGLALFERVGRPAGTCRS